MSKYLIIENLPYSYINRALYLLIRLFYIYIEASKNCITL